MEVKLPIYLDHNATTPVDPRVLTEMLPYFSEKFGNAASSTHSFGWKAAEAVDQAKERIANLINCEPGELIFTSGSTEGINLALKGVYHTYQSKGNHVVTVGTEHKAVLDTCSSLEKLGAQITYLPVDELGLIDLDQLEDAITDQTVLVCVMTANNESGVIQPIEAVANVVHKKGVIMMSDATQSVGKMKLDVQQMGIDLMPLSAHKFYGPKGIGVLYMRRKNPRVKLSPLIDGGGHQKGLRSGTMNVPGIVGMGMAAKLAAEELEQTEKHLLQLRDHLQEKLLLIDGAAINGHLDQRLPNTINISFSGVNSESLMRNMSTKVAVSSGSACTSAVKEPSYVLKAMEVSDELAFGSLRFSLGKDNTIEEMDYAAQLLAEEIERVRNLSAAS